jgi:hypothetical protein
MRGQPDGRVQFSGVFASLWGQWPGVIALLLVLTARQGFAESPEELIRYVPGSCNAVAIVRMADMLKSPRAVKEHWAQAANESFMADMGTIPPWVENLVIGFQVRPALQQEVWAAGVASVPNDLTIETLAQQNQQSVDQIAGFPAISGRGNHLILELKPGILGIWRPAIRQEAVRWANEIAAKITGPNSDYLAATPKVPGHLVLAIDVAGAFDPARTQMLVNNTSSDRTSAAARQQLQQLLMGTQGATLAVTVTDTVQARLQIDFSSPVGDHAPELKQFLDTVLQQLGAEIEELASATPQAQGRALVCMATLSDESVSRVMSLIATGSAMPQSMAATPNAAASKAVGQTESARYFSAIDRILKDLERANRRANANSPTALWHENFARKIDDLSIQRVDPKLVEYGRSVASKLRALGRSLRGQAVAVNAHEGTLTYESNFTPGWASIDLWGGIGAGQSAVNVTSNLQQVRERQAEAIIAGNEQRNTIWGMLKDERSQILAQMQAKFGEKFPR